MKTYKDWFVHHFGLSYDQAMGQDILEQSTRYHDAASAWYAGHLSGYEQGANLLVSSLDKKKPPNQ